MGEWKNEFFQQKNKDVFPCSFFVCFVASLDYFENVV